MQDIKKQIENKINDIEQMLNELNFNDYNDSDTQNAKPKIDINELDVVDVLNNILN
jgi:hypothetical protein